MPAHQTHARFAPCPSCKADWVSGIFLFFFSSRIWAAFMLAFSAFLVVARLRTWGLVVLVLCLTSAQITQHLLLSLKSMSNWQFWTGQSFVVAWRSLLITFHSSLARSRRIIVYQKSSKTDIARESQSHYSSYLVPPSRRCSYARAFSLS